MKIYLDDEREAPKGWTRIERSLTAIILLKSGIVYEISLDHDLGDDRRGTGYNILLWIENEIVINSDFKLPKITIHTANPPARKRMLAALDSIYKRYNRQRKG